MESTDYSASGRASQERPTVTKDKWITHALRKLEKGYILIVGNGRRSANFYRAGSGYEMCSYQAAVQMVRDGLVVKTHDHYLGTAYALSPRPAPDAPEDSVVAAGPSPAS
jgi:Rad3-related DNA helicase